jgi:hypothetical protein
MFDDDSNQAMNGTPDHMKVDIKHLCAEIKRYDFNLRLSLNMTDVYEKRFPLRLTDEYNVTCVEKLFDRAKELGADMVTFRQLYLSGDPTIEQNQWIHEHRASQKLMKIIDGTIKTRGRMLERLPFGVMRYSLNGMSLVVDDDCMATHETTAAMKYLVLRPNCKLYTRWDDEGSILF